MPKLPNHFGKVAQVVEKVNRKKKRPREIAVVVEGRCTGCQVCVEFCPVDCIQEGTPRPGVPLPPVAIRYDECIGCQLCARACTELTWDAIEMWETDRVEETFGMTIHESFDDFEGWAMPYTYTGVADGTQDPATVTPETPPEWPHDGLPPAPPKKPKKAGAKPVKAEPAAEPEA